MIPFSTLPGYVGALKKILYISPFAFKVSGADESLLALLKKNPCDRVRPFVAIPWNSPLLERYRATSARVFRLPMMRLQRSKNPLFWMAYFVFFPIEMLLFVFIVIRHSIDLVHINMESSLAPAFAANLVRRPLVVHYRGKTVDTPKWFFDLFIPLLSFLANRILCISKASGIGFYRRNRLDKLEIFPNPVDISTFAQAVEPRFFDPYRKKNNQKVITFIGRMDPQKRIPDLLSAAQLAYQKIPTFMVAIVGGDPDIAEEKIHLGQLRASLSLLQQESDDSVPVAFLGAQKDISSILHDSAALVLPSINEGFGRVVLEAMAAGTPVIVADSGALPELIEGGTYGMLVRACDPQDLARAIELVLSDDPQVKAKARLAQEYAHTFSIERYTQRLQQVYAELMGDVSS